MTFAGTFDATDAFNRRVTPQQSDSSRPTEQRQESLSPTERGLREHQRVQKLLADAELEKQRERAEIRQRREQQELKAQQEVQRQQAKAIFDATNTMLEQTMEIHGLTDEESDRVWDAMLRTKQVNIEFCELACMEIKARRVRGGSNE